MTEIELAEAITGRNNIQMVQRYAALAEMAVALGHEAVVLDFQQEGRASDRKYEIVQILMPYMQAGVRGCHDLHEVLTPDEHERIEALIRGD